VDIVYLANPSLSPEDTLHAIALEMKLDVDPEANRLQVMHVLQERLLEKHANNRQVVIFVEEAQSMPIATLEEIRLLSNLETNRDKLLQIVLFGQPELDDNLGQPEIRQLNERITHSFYLQAFTPEQMREYVNFRMRAVGYRGPDIFRGGAYRRMAKASEGLTRRINILADKALLAAFAEDTFDVGKRHVKIAINDSQFVRHRRWGLAEISLISGLTLIVAALAWTFLQRSDALGGRWQKLLTGGVSQEMSQPAAAPAETESAVALVPASPPVEPNPPAAGSADSARATSPGAPAATAAAAAPVAKDASDEGSRPAMVASAVPVVEGGSRLLLSDTLSKPPAADSREAAPEPAVESPAPAGAEAANGDSEQPAATVVAAIDTSPIEDAAPARSAAVDPPAESAPADSAPSDKVMTRGDGLGPLTEARLAATRTWLQSADDRHFSIQLLLTDFARRDNLEKFLREREAAGEVDDYYVFETRIRSSIWYGVLYKEYSSFGAAKAALDELPEEFRYHQPFIRNVRDIATLG
jgi:type II secretory pathway predicted ATPase ExeA/septal ring-binding cell division protein DamX